MRTRSVIAPHVKDQGRKEVAEAVIIAALTVAATNLINLGFQEIERLRNKARKAAKRQRQGRGAK